MTIPDHRVHEPSTQSDDTATLSRIDELVAAIREVRAGISLAHPLTARDQGLVADLQAELDDHWHVLRRRRSDRYFGV